MHKDPHGIFQTKIKWMNKYKKNYLEVYSDLISYVVNSQQYTKVVLVYTFNFSSTF